MPTEPVVLGVELFEILCRPDVRRDGADRAVDPLAEDLVAVVKELTDGLGVDVAFEVVGRGETVRDCLRLPRRGGTAMLVGAYNRAGELLWHIDRDGEWPDESQVTDLLAAAADWFDGHRPFTNAREDKDLDEYELPATDQPRPSQAAEADR